MIKYISISIVLIISFFCVPDNFSWNFNLFCFILFLVLFYFLNNDSQDNNYFNFNVLFSISFLFTSFIYPIFFFLKNTYDIPFFVYGFNEKIINKSTILALIGYNFYCFGAFFAIRHRVEYFAKELKYKNSINIFILYFLFFLFLYQVGFTNLIFSNYGGTNTWGSGAKYTFFILLAFLWVTIIIELNNNKKESIWATILSLNKFLLFFICLYCIFFLIVGNRANVISLLIIILGYISLHIKPMSKKTMFLIILIGFFSLSILSLLRTSKDDLNKDFLAGRNNSIQSVLRFGSDLMISNYTLYLLVDDADNNGYTYGHTMAGPIMGTFPFLISSYLSVSNDAEENLTSSLYITKKTLGNSEIGLGTNIVGDLYLSFGLLGVCIGLYLLGWFVNRMRVSAKSRALLVNIIYLSLLSWSVMLPRAEYFVYLRGLIWAVLLFLIIYNLQKSQRKISVINQK